MANFVLGFLLLAFAATGLCSLPRSDRRPDTGDEAALKQFLMRNNRLPYPNETDLQQPGVGDWTTCEGCKLLVREVGKLIKNPQEIDKLKEMLDRTCDLPILVRHKTECQNMINNIIVVLHQLEPILDNPTAVCEELKYCPDSIRGEITLRQRVTLLAAIKLLELVQPSVNFALPCDECIFAVSELRTLIQSQSIQAQIKQELHSLCRMAGQYESDCDAIIDQYFNMIIQQAVDLLSNGREVCADIGLCSTVSENGNGETKRSEGKTVVNLRPVHTRVGRVHLRPSALSSVSTARLDAFVYTIKRIQTRQGINAGCLLCQAGIQAAKDYLSQEQTAAMVSGDLTNFACAMVPRDMKLSCTDFMSIYSRALLQLLVSEYTPAQICTSMHVCKADDNRRIESLTASVKSEAVCEACQVVSQYLSFEFQQPGFQTEIVDTLKRACAVLPGDYATQCENSLVSYIPAALRFLADYLSRDVLCASVGACPTATSAPATSA